MRLFDAHLHIIDPRFPLIPNNGYLPPVFTVADYQNRTGNLNVAGGAVVSGSFQGADQTYLVDALRQLGPGFVGITQVPPTASDHEIVALHEAGVRGVRFNLYRGDRGILDHLDILARRVHEVAGWHTELYVDSTDLPDLQARLLALPRISIDHLGMSQPGQRALLRLVAGGARVKATGFGRVDLDVAATLRAIHEVNPSALMVGTDLPSPRARRPFADEDLDLVRQVLGTDAGKVFYDNAASLYLSHRA